LSKCARKIGFSFTVGAAFGVQYGSPFVSFNSVEIGRSVAANWVARRPPLGSKNLVFFQEVAHLGDDF
jgi:hypothetical protein